MYIWGFPGGSVVKNVPINAGDMHLIPGLGRSPGEGNGNPLRYSCLADPLDREPGRLQSMGMQSQTRLTEQKQPRVYMLTTNLNC